jgi:hypothetical protein
VKALLLVSLLGATLVFGCDKQATSASNGIVARHETEGQTPEGTLRLFLEACIEAGQADEARAKAAMAAIGELAAPIRGDADWATRHSNRTFAERLKTHPWVFRSYAPGATPDNGYAATLGYVPAIASKIEESDGLKLMVRSGGADSPRPVRMKQVDGRWYVQEWSSLYLEVRPPAK